MKKKKLSKKKVGFIAILIVVISVISGVTFMKRNNDTEEFTSIPREYTVEKGDIVAAFTGGGQIKLGGKDYNFSKPVTLENVFVTVGQSVKAGDALASISEESIQKRLEELNDELKKAKLSLDQANNSKELSVLNNNKAWNQTTQNSKEQYETEKSGIESEIKKLDEQLASIQTQTHNVQNQINAVKQEEENSTSNEEVTPQDANEGEGVTPQNEERDNDTSMSGEETKSSEEVAAMNGTAEVNQAPAVTPRIGFQEQLDELNLQLEDLKQQETAVRAQISDALNRLNELKGRREKEIQQESSEAASNQEINNKSLQEFDNSITLAQMEVDRIQKQINEVNQLKETKTLVAESDGIVTAVGYAANSETTVETPVVTIGSLEQVTAELTVSQSDLNKLEEGQNVSLEATAFPGETISAKVKSINYSPIQEGSNIVYKVIVEVESTHQLIEGMTVSAKFIIKEVKDVLTLSNKAIEYKDGKQIVKVKREDGSTEEVEVITGFSDGRVSEIKSGLNEGDIVVVGG